MVSEKNGIKVSSLSDSMSWRLGIMFVLSMCAYEDGIKYHKQTIDDWLV